jgi:hypothetical protein
MQALQNADYAARMLLRTMEDLQDAMQVLEEKISQLNGIDTWTDLELQNATEDLQKAQRMVNDVFHATATDHGYIKESEQDKSCPQCDHVLDFF